MQFDCALSVFRAGASVCLDALFVLYDPVHKSLPPLKSFLEVRP